MNLTVLGATGRTGRPLVAELLTRSMVADKAVELPTWRDTELDWTLVRPPRLVDGPATGRVEHDAYASTRSTRMHRAALVVFLTEVLEQELYLRQAPFAATATAES